MDEPSPANLPSPFERRLAATRPGFLAASLVPVLIGLGAASRVAEPHFASAALSLAGALAAHAGINVLNDVYDHRAGCDTHNDERIFPYTGGSRMIQNRVMSPQQMARLGWSLMLAAAASGVLLLAAAGPWLLPLGLAGTLLGWAYSAPPLRLSARGLGEACVGLGFGVVIPLGAALVQTSRLEATALWAGLPYGLLTTALLFINQFPDYRADAATGKRNLVVRLGRERAWPLYPALALLAYAAVALAVALGGLPALCLLSLGTAPLHALAARQLAHAALAPSRLARPIRLSLLAALVHGALMAITLAAG